MLGKKARVVGQTVLFACVVRTWRNRFRKRGGFPIQGLNYDAATLPVVRKTAPARATLLSAWQMASVILLLPSSSLASLMALASDARQRLACSRWQADSRVVSVCVIFFPQWLNHNVIGFIRQSRRRSKGLFPLPVRRRSSTGGLSPIRAGYPRLAPDRRRLAPTGKRRSLQSEE